MQFVYRSGDSKHGPRLRPHLHDESSGFWINRRALQKKCGKSIDNDLKGPFVHGDLKNVLF